MQIARMPDLYKTLWQDVLFKTTQKFRMRQLHYFLLVAISIVFVFKINMAIVYSKDAVSGNSHLVRVTAQVFYDLCRAAEGCIGMYISFFLPHDGKNPF